MSGSDPQRMPVDDASAATLAVNVVTPGAMQPAADQVTVEEPLEIRLCHGPEAEELSLSVTMRTPGHDRELALGFLFSEGVIRKPEDVLEVSHSHAPETADGRLNVIRVVLAPYVRFDVDMLAHNFFTSSSCGLCGKTSISAVSVQIPDDLPPATIRIREELLRSLPARLREQQAQFSRTGGLHASGLFTADAEIVAVREDVGRHNALDKLFGSRFPGGGLPLPQVGLILSGRASFELIQKAAMAGIGLVAAIGPPSSLAVALAVERQMTLIGFLNDARFNVYSAPYRIAL